MAKYFLTKKAVDDLTEIWNYTFEEWSEQQADKYYQMLIDNFKELAQNPKLGRNYDGIMTTLYGLKVTRHIIFYRKLSENEIEITRILHDRMDLKSRIKE
jgi:toxin ParE1/3/4